MVAGATCYGCISFWQRRWPHNSRLAFTRFSLPSKPRSAPNGHDALYHTCDCSAEPTGLSSKHAQGLSTLALSPPMTAKAYKVTLMGACRHHPRYKSYSTSHPLPATHFFRHKSVYLIESFINRHHQSHQYCRHDNCSTPPQWEECVVTARPWPLHHHQNRARCVSLKDMLPAN